jgi:hypothetical protein
VRHHYADDGRIMTPPIELKPLLKSSFDAFSELIGHIRFFYIANEIWDGEYSLLFSADGEQFIAITLADGAFNVHIAKKNFRITDEILPEAIIETLKRAVPLERCRPSEQLTMNMDDPAKFPCGYRCDMCLLNRKQNEDDFSASNKFGYLNWLCYCDCVPNMDIERPEQNGKNEWSCPGCASSPWKKECRYFICPIEKGYANCIECGEYHSCDVQSDGHYSAQCSLGMTAEEVTSLVIPYCMKERFDIFHNSALQAHIHLRDFTLSRRKALRAMGGRVQKCL